jgi:dimethylamine corrinoid protein
MNEGLISLMADMQEEETLAFDSTKKNIEAIEAAGLDDSIMIMIGGDQIDKEVRTYTGADAYSKDAATVVQFSKQWIGV